MSDKRPILEKHPCSRCGEPCFRIAYIGYRLVCAACFREAVSPADTTEAG